MTSDLDYPQLQTACWRAICRHQISELEQLIASTVIRLSFGIGEPCLRLDYAVELSRLTGISKGKSADVVKRLVRGRALEVSADRTLYTFLPPSRSWPWLFAERVNFALANALEANVIGAAKGPQQGEFFGPTPEREFAEALFIERMRTSLIEHHQEVAARFCGAGAQSFPATDRSPTPAPGFGLSSGEGPTRPLGTSAQQTHCTEDSLPRAAPCRDHSAPPAGKSDGSRKGNPVPDSGTSLLRAFKASEEAKAFNPLKAFKAKFPNREPLPPIDPGASEDEMIVWLRLALGEPVMVIHGGGWREAIRKNRYAALNAFMELKLRLRADGLKPLRNPGGWLRDQYNKIVKECDDSHDVTTP